MVKMNILASCLVLILFTGADALYSSSDDVVLLTQSTFDRRVKDSDEVWLIEFYAPWCGHCQQFAPEWKKAASALKGIVKVGAIDCDSEKGLAAQFGIRGFPTVKIFTPEKSAPEDFNGARTAQSVVDAGLNAARSLVNSRLRGGSKPRSSKRDDEEEASDANNVIELSDSNFDQTIQRSDDMWLVEFYAPWCGHCKALAPEWKKAANQLKGRVKVAAVDATANQQLAQRYGIQGFPTIKMIPAGKKNDLVADAVPYEGGRTASDIVAWAEDKLADSAPPPSVEEITGQHELQTACEKQLCVIAVLPSLLDCNAQCRNRYITLLKEMAVKYKRSLWGWLWTEAGAYTALERSIGIGGFTYPSLAALNIRKQKYALLRRAFSADGLTDFFRELSVGRGGTEPFEGATLPSIESRAAWDGRDAKLDSASEEIDLSDVDLEDDAVPGWKTRRKVVDASSEHILQSRS